MAKPKPPTLVAGLGNPGADYAMTRHNAGFLTVDALARRHGVTYWKSKAGCEVAEVTISGRTVTLAKPQAYMNASGGPISKLMRELGTEPAELLVVHDEVDLAAGEVRDKFGGGLNAHNGLRSIKAKLSTPDFWRLRVGIGRPPGKMSVADWALRKLKGDFAEDFLVTIEAAADAVERLTGQA